MPVAAGDGKVSDATMTRMQELGSAWVFKRAIQDNQRFYSVQDIKTGNPNDGGETFNEIKRIWKEVGNVNWVDAVDNEWLENFYKQSEVLLPEVGNAKFTLFTRDTKSSDDGKFTWQKEDGETFMEWVSNLIKDEFEIGNKDNWNPADIWIIRNEKHWKDEIKRIWVTRHKNPKNSLEVELARFNSLFRRLFRTKQIMGISLKKVGNTATFKPVNVTGSFFKTLEATHMTLKSAKCLLGTKRITEKQIADALARGKKNPRTGLPGLGKVGAATLAQDTILIIEDPGIGPSGKPTTYKVQIKANNSTGFSNLKWEPTIEGKSKARMGKATVELVLDLMKVYGMMKPGDPNSYEPDNKVFPDDKSDFSGKVLTSYKKIIKEMMKFVNFGPGVDVETAIINIRETFDIYRGQPWVASSKLQQIRFLYALFKLGPKERDDFCTSLIFAAGKEGKRYGPYGKIY